MRQFLPILFAAALLSANPPIHEASWGCSGFSPAPFPPPPPHPPGEPQEFTKAQQDQNARFAEWRKANWCAVLKTLAPAPGKFVLAQPAWERIIVIRAHAWFGLTYQVCFASRRGYPTLVNFQEFPSWSEITNQLREAFNANQSLDPTGFAKSLSRAEGQFFLDPKGEAALAKLANARLPRKRSMPNPDDANFWVLVLKKGRRAEMYEYFGSQDYDHSSVTSRLFGAISSHLNIPLAPQPEE
jgi:hypothetical protein